MYGALACHRELWCLLFFLRSCAMNLAAFFCTDSIVAIFVMYGSKQVNVHSIFGQMKGI